MGDENNELSYRRFGTEGPVCIILHGLLGSGDNWETPAKKTSSTGCRVYTLDLRNHGKSFHAKEMNYPVMAEDVHRFIAGLKEGPVYLIGHSMGGKVGMELALAHPEDVDRLIVVDISPFRYKPIYANVFSALQGLDISGLSSRGEADRQLQNAVPDRLVRLFLLKNLGRDEKGNFYWRINLEALANNYHHIWAGIDTSRRFEKPALFIEGEKSEAGIKLQFDEIRKSFPHAEYKGIRGAGHWVHSEKPRDFLSAVKNFLTEHKR